MPHSLLLSVAALAVLLQCVPVCGAKDDKTIMCGTCKAVVDSIEKGIANTAEKHDMQVRFRLDEKERVPYKRSEFRVMEVIDETCKGMTNYATSGEAPHKRVIKMDKVSGSFSNLNMDADTTRAVQRVCEYLIDEYNDDFLLTFRKATDDTDPIETKKKLCKRIIGACPSDDLFIEEEFMRDAEPDEKPDEKSGDTSTSEGDGSGSAAESSDANKKEDL